VFSRIPLALLFISLSACVQSDHPLADPDQAQVDNRLFGQWHHKSPKDGTSWHVFLAKPRPGVIKDLPASLLVLQSVEYSANNEAPISREMQCGITVKIGGEYYINFLGKDLLDSDKHLQWKKENVKSTYFYKYGIEGDLLTWWMVDPNLAAAEVKRGRLKGNVKAGTFLPDVQITESTQGLVKYLRDGGHRDLFNDNFKLTFKRVRW
jgi:hypothetical protein